MSTDRQSLEKHMTGKEVLRAIADGARPSDFEIRNVISGHFEEFNSAGYSVNVFFRDENQFRRKPRTRVVNGFTVPAPIQEMPKDGDVLFAADPTWGAWFTEFSFSRRSNTECTLYSRGLLFSTKEAAIANAKAMVGVDPEAT